MSRKRPTLKDWNAHLLHDLDTSDPEHWVGTVLGALPRETDRKWPKWRFGEIREAIRRELTRRGMEPGRAEHLAHTRTSRGIHALREQGALTASESGYRLRLKWAMARAIRETVHRMVLGEIPSTFRLEPFHLPEGGHGVRLRFSSRQGYEITAAFPVTENEVRGDSGAPGGGRARPREIA